MNSNYRLQLILLCALFIIFPLNLYAAKYSSALNAYERRDYNNAIQQFTELAYNRDGYAQYMLGKIFASGEGVSRDYVRAYSWLHLAEQNGVDSAARLKHKIGKKMSKGQLKQARRLAAQWRPGIYHSPRTAEISDPAVVRKVQHALARDGYYYHNIDGLAGKNTRAAIKKYQRAAGLYQDGRITNKLLNSMQLSSTITDSSSSAGHDEHRKLTMLKKKIRRLAHRAQKKDAADPWVIRQLEELAGKETVHWSRLILEEKFNDENYQGGPDWRVRSGNFHLQRSTGLIISPESNWGAASYNQDDITSRLLDLLLSQVQLQNSDRRVAKIEIPKNYANSFALEVTTGPLDKTEALIFSCSHDVSATSGYRLVLQPGGNNQELHAKLFSVSGNNTHKIKTVTNVFRIKDDSSHNIEWTRSRNGEMIVTIDGQNLLKSSYSGDSRPFAELGVAHVGNRLVMKRIKLLDSDTDYSRI